MTLAQKKKKEKKPRNMCKIELISQLQLDTLTQLNTHKYVGKMCFISVTNPYSTYFKTFNSIFVFNIFQLAFLM